MCNSVLSPEQIRLVSQFDTKAKKGDLGGAYLGQDPRFLWAKKGLDKFQKQLKKIKEKSKEKEPVSSDLIEKNPDVHKQGIQKGWFRRERSRAIDIFGRTQSQHLRREHIEDEKITSTARIKRGEMCSTHVCRQKNYRSQNLTQTKSR